MSEAACEVYDIYSTLSKMASHILASDGNTSAFHEVMLEALFVKDFFSMTLRSLQERQPSLPPHDKILHELSLLETINQL